MTKWPHSGLFTWFVYNGGCSTNLLSSQPMRARLIIFYEILYIRLLEGGSKIFWKQDNITTRDAVLFDAVRVRLPV